MKILILLLFCVIGWVLATDDQVTELPTPIPLVGSNLMAPHGLAKRDVAGAVATAPEEKSSSSSSESSEEKDGKVLFFFFFFFHDTKTSNASLINGLPYFLIRKDRPNRRGGGVCALIKNNLHHIPLPNSTEETIAFDLFLDNENIIRCILSYRHSQIKPCDAFHDFAEIFNLPSPFQPTDLIMLGDFNLPQIKWSNFLPTLNVKNSINIAKLVNDFCQNFNLKQLVNLPTRIDEKKKCASVLDLVFSSTHRTQNVAPLPKDDDISNLIFPTLDHSVVSFDIKCQLPPKENIISTYYDFANGDYEAFNYHISLIKWEEELSKCQNADDKFGFIKNVILDGIYKEEFIPQKKFNSSQKDYGCCPKIIEEMKEKYIKLVNDPVQTNSSRILGKKLFKAFRNFVSKSQKKLLSNQKTLYKCLADVTKTKYAAIPTLIVNDAVINDDTLKAEKIKEKFKSDFNISNASILLERNEPQPNSLNEIIFNKDTVEKCLKECKNKNLSGPDQIPGIILKKCAKTLSLPFVHLFNHIIQNCDIPKEFMMAHVTPIPKVSNPSTISDYRPISGTSDVLKTLERYIKELIMIHLKWDNFLPKEQFGFRAQHSTTKQMLLFTEHVNRCSSKKYTSDVIYIDLQKAFDKLPFDRILEALKGAKIGGSLLNLIMKLLSHREFLVKVNGKQSSKATADSGVGQGSVLGPIIFIIVFSALSKKLNEMGGIIHYAYADDLKIVYSYSKKNYDPTILQNALNTVAEWCESESMAVAPHKTFHVQFGPANPDAKYSLNDVEIQRKEMTRDLGLYINNQCSIKEHVDIITSNARKCMFSILNKIITNDEKILIKIFNTYVRPHLEYGSQIFNIPQKNIINQLESIQQKFTRTLYKRNHPTTTVIPPYSERLKKYEMVSLHQRRNEMDILMAFDFVEEKNLEIDLYFHQLERHRDTGYYRPKKYVTGKYSNTHFSTRVSSLLNKYGILFEKIQSKEVLKNKLSTIDLTTPKLF